MHALRLSHKVISPITFKIQLKSVFVKDSQLSSEYSPVLDGFFGHELYKTYDMHFLIADGMYITIVRLKRWVVRGFLT